MDEGIGVDKVVDYKYSLEIMKEQLKNKYISPEIKYAFQASIKALEKQAFFENEVSLISDWFVGNKQSLLDSALVVSKKEFTDSDIDNYIDGINLNFIVEDIVDEIHENILNVLSTFKGGELKMAKRIEMDNKKAIDYFFRQMELGSIRNDTEQMAYELATGALQEQQDNRWIPVSERLPTMQEYNENDSRFIVTDGNKVYQQLFDIYAKKEFLDIKYKGNCSLEEVIDNNVIAWRKLPRPYRGR